MSQRLLLVEDDPVLARGLRFNLESEGYAVQHVDSGGAALDAVAAEPPALVLLDLSLPDMDGLEVLRALRERGAPPPIVCLTARAAETDVVMALREGADDYVKKPFGLAELLARVDAVLRRAGAESAAPGVRIGEVLVELEARKLVHADREEELTPTEAELLAYLLQRRGQALERAAILSDLWGLSDARASRTLDNHVARLRRKLEPDAGQPRHLVTVHGIGYRLERDGV